MARRIRIRRTQGTEAPTDLAFGEFVLIDGGPEVRLGRADGSYLVISTGPLGPLADVALTGDYDDLTNKPDIPALPPLADVALTGDYDDLINKPTALGAAPDLIPPDGVEVSTNQLWHNGTGYKRVYLRRLNISAPYPSGNYIVRSHGITGIEEIVDFALYFRGGGYLYRVQFAEIPSGIVDTAIFGLTDWIWGSPKNRNSDGSTTQGAYFLLRYTKADGLYVEV